MPKMVRNCPCADLSLYPRMSDNTGMEKLLQTLSEIGMPAGEVQRIREYYRDDEPGLRHYVMYIRAMFDDRREYI